MEEYHTPELLEFMDRTIQNLAFVIMYEALIANFQHGEAGGLEAPGAKGSHTDPETVLKRAWAGFERNISPSAFRRMCLEITIARHVDALEYYLSRMLRRLFTHRPDILKTSQSMTLKEILEFEDMAELVRAVADRKVLNLTYRGLPKIVGYLNVNLGLGFDTNMNAFKHACEFVEVRHLIVHNGGQISTTYLQRTGRSDLHMGELYPLTLEYTLSGHDSLYEFAISMDSRFVSHFKLPGVRADVLKVYREARLKERGYGKESQEGQG